MKLISLIAYASLGSTALLRRADDAPAYQNNTTHATPGISNYTSPANSTAQKGSSYNGTKPMKAKLHKKTVTTTSETSESHSNSSSSTTTSSHFYTAVVRGRKSVQPKKVQSAPTNSSVSGNY
ncbi:hypothetical protein DSO57_1013533 [Entomophthora muscae]|uniref:Uncharacterized protein n=1 Tax=Entomophthora muscae TaxID=34485 RepID=A0ACC2UR71_9FUNG|nr:hypothetical protein DSO57_1013533 [Entomophthora muscae]